MIPQGKVDEIRQLLADGKCSQRRIAKITGVSRASIGLIASGKRPDYPPRVSAREDRRALRQGPIGRCPECGARVYLPCQACRVRGAMNLRGYQEMTWKPSLGVVTNSEYDPRQNVDFARGDVLPTAGRASRPPRPR